MIFWFLLRKTNSRNILRLLHIQVYEVLLAHHMPIPPVMQGISPEEVLIIIIHSSFLLYFDFISFTVPPPPYIVATLGQAIF